MLLHDTALLLMLLIPGQMPPSCRGDLVAFAKKLKQLVPLSAAAVPLQRPHHVVLMDRL